MILVDGRNEETKTLEKERLGLQEDEEELDIAIGEAEYPYFDFIGIEDRWVPDKKSFQKALKGKFNACLVKFANVGHMLVPWGKDKFKTEFSAFIKSREEEKEKEEKSDQPKKVTIVKFTPEMISGLMKAAEEDEEKKDE